jgi:hypothetical protein
MSIASATAGSKPEPNDAQRDQICRSTSIFDHGDGLGGVEALRAGLSAIQNGVAAVEPVPLTDCLIAPLQISGRLALEKLRLGGFDFIAEFPGNVRTARFVTSDSPENVALMMPDVLLEQPLENLGMYGERKE